MTLEPQPAQADTPSPVAEELSGAPEGADAAQSPADVPSQPTEG